MIVEHVRLTSLCVCVPAVCCALRFRADSSDACKFTECLDEMVVTASVGLLSMYLHVQSLHLNIYVLRSFSMSPGAIDEYHRIAE